MAAGDAHVDPAGRQVTGAEWLTAPPTAIVKRRICASWSMYPGWECITILIPPAEPIVRPAARLEPRSEGS